MKILETEIWKDIPNYEGLYQASNFGRIKSFDKVIAQKNNSRAIKKGRILKPSTSHSGYYQIVLSKQSIRKSYKVHRLIWLAFYGSIPEGYEVNHINEIKTDNRVSNLNLMTAKENLNWGTRNERIAKKRINGKGSKPVLQFTLDDDLIKEYASVMQVEREKGFDNTNIVKSINKRMALNGSIKNKINIEDGYY